MERLRFLKTCISRPVRYFCQCFVRLKSEENFLENMDALACIDPAAQWRFVTDNFSTSASESWVRYLDSPCGIETELGFKGSHGHLRSLQSRRSFLADKSHRIRLVYTPKYCRLLKQINFWFGTLRRTKTCHGSLSSLQDLGDQIPRFIGYDNETMARPYRVTCEGRVLCKSQRLSPHQASTPNSGNSL